MDELKGSASEGYIGMHIYSLGSISLVIKDMTIASYMYCRYTACMNSSLTQITAASLILAKKPNPSMYDISEQVMGAMSALDVLLERHSFPSHPLVLSSNIILTMVSDLTVE